MHARRANGVVRVGGGEGGRAGAGAGANGLAGGGAGARWSVVGEVTRQKGFFGVLLLCIVGALYWSTRPYGPEPGAAATAADASTGTVEGEALLVTSIVPGMRGALDSDDDAAVAEALGLSEAYPVYELKELDNEALDLANGEVDASSVPSVPVKTTSAAAGASGKAAARAAESSADASAADQTTRPAPQDDPLPDPGASTTSATSATPATPVRASVGDLGTGIDIDDDDALFEDAAGMRTAPIIQVMPESSKLKYRVIVLQHERYYRNNPSRLYVPRLRKNVRLTQAQFAERFMKTSQPVIVPFEAMEHLGFTSKPLTLEQLLEIYPNHKPRVYKYGSPGPGEVDLGPAVASLANSRKLVKTKVGRNFPRNMKVRVEAISKLGVMPPPFVLEKTTFMLPSLWFATGKGYVPTPPASGYASPPSESTKFHSDCCDNYAMMVTGTKRWTLAPPSEARLLKPNCQGVCVGSSNSSTRTSTRSATRSARSATNCSL